MTNEPTELQKAVEPLPCPFCGESVSLPYPHADRIQHPASFKKPICPLSYQLVVLERWNTQAAAKQLSALQKENEELKTENTVLGIAATNCALVTQERDSITAALKVKDRTLCFFASVIKSGESWSSTCEKAFQEALSSRCDNQI